MISSHVLSIFSEYFNEYSVFYRNKHFCNMLNIFTVTFDQFDASLLNKSIHLFPSKNKKNEQKIDQ